MSENHITSEEQLMSYIQNSNISKAVFDFDGTMLYTEDLHWHYYHLLFSEVFNIDYPYPLHENTTGMRYDEAMEWFSHYYGFDVNDPRITKYKKDHPHRIFEELSSINRNHYSYLNKVVSLLHDNGTKLYVLSANDIYTISDRLHQWNMDEIFSAVYSVVSKSENKIDILKNIIASDTAIVFDDSPRVLSSYKKCQNATVVAIRHPFSKALLDNDPKLYDFVIDVEEECDLITEAKIYY